MGQILPFTPEKLIVPILLSRNRVRNSLLEQLQNRYGRIDYASPDLPFPFTHYYDEEMGTPITRLIVSFDRLVDPGILARIKIETNRLECEYAAEGKRKVNLDPGLLSLSRLILASSKDGSHRIPLDRGIYAEVTLVYEGGEYRALPWTYPDYASREYRSILKQIRTLYKAQISDRSRRGSADGAG